MKYRKEEEKESILALDGEDAVVLEESRDDVAYGGVSAMQGEEQEVCYQIQR